MTGILNHAQETCRKNHVDPSRSTQNAANSGEHVVQAQHESAMQEKEALSSPTSTSTVSQDHPADRHYDQDHAYNAQKSTGAIAKAEIAATNTASGAEEDDDDFPEGGLQAWLVVLGSFSAQFIIYGIINSTGALQAYLLQNELKNSDPEQVAWIFSINLFMVFFCGIYAGRIFDTRGPRGLVAVGSGCLVLSMFLLSLCTGKSVGDFGLDDMLRMDRVLAFSPGLFYPGRYRWRAAKYTCFCGYGALL